MVKLVKLPFGVPAPRISFLPVHVGGSWMAAVLKSLLLIGEMQLEFLAPDVSPIYHWLVQSAGEQTSRWKCSQSLPLSLALLFGELKSE